MCRFLLLLKKKQRREKGVSLEEDSVEVRFKKSGVKDNANIEQISIRVLTYAGFVWYQYEKLNRTTYTTYIQFLSCTKAHNVISCHVPSCVHAVIQVGKILTIFCYIYSLSEEISTSEMCWLCFHAIACITERTQWHVSDWFFHSLFFLYVFLPFSQLRMNKQARKKDGEEHHIIIQHSFLSGVAYKCVCVCVWLLLLSVPFGWGNGAHKIEKNTKRKLSLCWFTKFSRKVVLSSSKTIPPWL